ncbi:MAG: adenylyltransferase/cytidyltransferase family protein [Candidatus Pacearchaeota archaeon]
MVTVAASGYFDPLHKGHIEYLQEAKNLGDRLVVIVNSDLQASLKKGKSFMPQDQRIAIIESLSFVDEVFLSIDKDKSVCLSLAKIKPDIFAKGGDRTAGEIPEGDVCKRLGIKIVDGLGAKVESSSRLISEASNSVVQKPWGTYTDFIREGTCVIKEITVSPNKRLSLQSHNKRKEYWIVISGEGKAVVGEEELPLREGSIVLIDFNQKHRIINDTDKTLRIAEVQLGECLETDVVRYEDDFGRQGTNT